MPHLSDDERASKLQALQRIALRHLPGLFELPPEAVELEAAISKKAGELGVSEQDVIEAAGRKAIAIPRLM